RFSRDWSSDVCSSDLAYPLRHPRALPVLGSMLAAGAARVRGVEHIEPIVPETVLDVPGSPRVIATPGHTLGHIALHLADHDALRSEERRVGSGGRRRG